MGVLASAGPPVHNDPDSERNGLAQEIRPAKMAQLQGLGG